MQQHRRMHFTFLGQQCTCCWLSSWFFFFKEKINPSCVLSESAINPFVAGTRCHGISKQSLHLFYIDRSIDRSELPSVRRGLIYWTRSPRTLILNYIDNLFPLTYCACNQIKHGVRAACHHRPCCATLTACLPSALTWKLAATNFSRAIVFESWENRLAITFYAG